MSDSVTGACISDEEMAAFVEGTLDVDAHARVSLHVDGCNVCRRLVAHAASDGGPAPLARGAPLGRYVVIEPLGTGAMGVVYAAYDPDLDRKVAVKLLRPDGSDEDRAALRGRLLREARALARLSHPSVVSVHDVGAVGDEVFLAMQLVDGGTLRDWAGAAPRSWRDIVRVFALAGEGLAAAHAAGVVHRDFKPDNVLVGAGGRVWVADFGLARDVSLRDDRVRTAAVEARMDAALTRTGALAGTPAYMAPEQLAGGAATNESDQYAFALACFEVLYGTRPSGPASFAAKRDGSKPPVALKSILLRALAADPSARWPSMRALLDAIERVARPSRGATIWLAVAALLVVGAGISAFVAAKREPPCAGAATSFDRAWSAPIRVRVEDAMRQSGARDWALTFAALDRELGRYGDAFREGHRQACVATRVTQEQSEAVMDRRMECLAGRLNQAELLTKALAAAPDARAVERSVDVARALPDIATCAQVDVLSGLAPLPRDPARRAEVVALDERLARLVNARRLGGGRELEAPLEAAIADAERLGWSRAGARAWLELSKLRYEGQAGGDPWLATSEAAASALAGRDDEALAAAWVQILELEAHYNRVDRAEHAFRQAEAAQRRLGSPPRQRAEALSSLAVVYNRTGRDLDKGMRMLTEAEKLARPAVDPDDPLLARLESRLGAACHYVGRYADALTHLQRALEIMLRSHGPLHPNVDNARVNVGEELAVNGRPAEGVAMIREVLARRDENAHFHDSLAVALELAGELAEAELARRRTLAACRVAHDDACVRWATARLGALLVKVGRHADAVPLLEQSLVDVGEVRASELARARVALAVALQRTGGDPARITGLARDAAVGIRAWAEQYGGTYRELLSEADAIVAADAVTSRARRPARTRTN